MPGKDHCACVYVKMSTTQGFFNTECNVAKKWRFFNKEFDLQHQTFVFLLNLTRMFFLCNNICFEFCKIKKKKPLQILTLTYLMLQ